MNLAAQIKESLPLGQKGLVAGTLVTTPDGDKKIEDIKAGDLVLSGVGMGITRFFKVKQAKSKHYSGPMLCLKSRGVKRLLVTPNHICFADSLKEKNKDGVGLIAFVCFGKNNSTEHWVVTLDDWIKKRDLDEAESCAINLSRSRSGEEINRFAKFADSKFNDVYKGTFQFIPACDLRTGMKIPIATIKAVKSSTITNITEEQYDGLVYDLDIPHARNFAANGVLIHDSTSSTHGLPCPPSPSETPLQFVRRDPMRMAGHAPTKADAP